MTAVRELLTLSKTDDWHSPHDFVEAGRYTLGDRIDRDPASCWLANTIVKAEHYYTEQDDGLSKPWDVPDENGPDGARRAADVWWNPPSSSDSSDHVFEWWLKCMREMQAGRVRAFVAFIFRAAAIPSMAYQAARAGLPGPHQAWRCEPGRVKFLKPRKPPEETPPVEVVLEPIIVNGIVVPQKRPKKPRKAQERFVAPLPGFELPTPAQGHVVVADDGSMHERGEQPMHDSALLCMGPADVLARFRESFAPLGHVMPPEWRQ